LHKKKQADVIPCYSVYQTLFTFEPHTRFCKYFFHLSDQLHEGPEKMKVDRIVQNYYSQFVTENSVSYII